MHQENPDSETMDSGKNGEGACRPKPLIDPVTKRRIPTYREWFNKSLGLNIPIPPRDGDAAGRETK